MREEAPCSRAGLLPKKKPFGHSSPSSERGLLAFSRNQEERLYMKYRFLHFLALVCAGLFIALAAMDLVFLPPSFGKGEKDSQQTFASAEDAAKALGTAYKRGDPKGVAKILGDKGLRLVSSGDPVIDRYEREWFLSLYEEGHELMAESETRAVLQLGKDEYPYPIPIVKEGDKWRFDLREGLEDLLSRRISKAELSALNLMVACVDAQRAYYGQDHDGDGVFEYARKFRSSPGQHDGLYWERKPGEAPSPVTGLVDAFLKEGYGPAEEGQLFVYRGYFYKMLAAQGAHALGGARDYIVNGKMSGGFAMVAFPARYRVSGVLTFMVNQEAVVYQKDLGPKTVALGKEMALFDPDKSWSKGARTDK
jgi:Protein of unknown function (DUF2950)